MRRHTLAAVLLWALALALRGIGLTAPWGADNLGTAGAFFSIAARNYARYGYVATALVPVVTAEGPPSPAVYYTHHPPLLELLVSASFAVFGVHEWAARLVPLAFSIVGLALLLHLARRFYGERVALLTLAIAATLPLENHLAAHVDVQGSIVLACVLATLTCIAHRRFAAAVLCLTVGIAADWPALYLPILLVVAPWPFAFPRPWRFLAGLLLYAAILFVVLSSWLSGPSAVLGLLYERALSFHSDAGSPFGLVAWLRTVVGWYLWHLCTPAVLVAVAVWCIWRVPTIVRASHPERLTLLLLLFGAVHMIVGFQGAYQHEFWATYLRAGIPLACALVLDRIGAAVPDDWRRTLVTGTLLVIVGGPGIAGTLRLAAHPLSERWLDADYTPRQLAEEIRACTPAGRGALTSDWSGESAVFFYADRPLAIGVDTVEALAQHVARPRYDPPGGSGTPYEAAVRPACFVLPDVHARYFPELAVYLRARYGGTLRGRFEIFRLDEPAAAGARVAAPAMPPG